MPNPKGFENLKVKTESTNELYADALYAPVINFSDIETYESHDNGSYYTPQHTFNINDKTPKMPFGFRIGYAHTSLRPFGLSFDLEAGLRPGMPGIVNTAYGLVKFTFSLSWLE